MPTPDDDEITTDVDPAWIEAIKADTGATTGNDHEPDWHDAEPAWDPEATVGASDGLMERIRREVDASAAPGNSVAPPLAPSIPSPAPAPVAPAAGPPAPAAPSTAPPPLPPALVDDAVSTTVRWEPRQRLASPAPVTQPVVISDHAPSGLDRTKVAIAIVAAVAIIIVVWLVVGSGGSDPAPPVDSVPTSNDGTGTATTLATANDTSVAPPADSTGAGG